MLTGDVDEDEPLPKSLNPTLKIYSLIKSGLIQLSLSELDVLPESTVRNLQMLKEIESQVLEVKRELARKSRGR